MPFYHKPNADYVGIVMDACLMRRPLLKVKPPINAFRGQPVADALAKLLDRGALKAEESVWPIQADGRPQRMKAVIREDECIGCTKCISACPVDAIIGSGKLMHTVLTDLCTGCELCIPPAQLTVLT